MMLKFVSEDQTGKCEYYINSIFVIDIEVRKNEENIATVFNIHTSDKSSYISLGENARENYMTFWDLLNNVMDD